MTRPRDGGYVRVTGLAKYIAGETACPWAAWFRTHFAEYHRVPSDFHLATWTAQHNRLVSEVAAELTAAGAAVFREAQNAFTLRPAPGLVLAGQPDLVAIGRDGRVELFDCKTGQPRESDLLQVMLYMLCLPHAHPRFRGLTVAGCVVYRHGGRRAVPLEAITSEFKSDVRYFVDCLAAAEPLPRAPAPTTCRFCDLGVEDCPERVEAGDDPAEPVSVGWDAL